MKYLMSTMCDNMEGKQKREKCHGIDICCGIASCNAHLSQPPMQPLHIFELSGGKGEGWRAEYG